MKEVILLKCGELVLKGQNRRNFEDTLIKSARRRLAPYGDFRLYSAQSTIYVEPLSPACNMEGATDALQKVFGVAALTRAAVVEKRMEDVKARAETYLRSHLRTAKTFKVEAKRADKTFPQKSPEICAQLGEALLEAYPHLRVDVHQPDYTVYVEIREKGAYLHIDQLSGAGGLPVGTSGKGMLLLSGGIDSPVAGYRMARRGMEIYAVHFASPPYTSGHALEKVRQLCRKMSAYTGQIKLFVVGFTAVQEAIRKYCPDELSTVLLRRCMMETADKLARREGCGALITGECLAQVASQTVQALACTDDAADLPVLRPLIGMDKDEIVVTARHIDTFATSILPYEDCCTVFTPKKPKTRPRLAQVLEAEAKLEGRASLLESALEAAIEEHLP